MTLHRLTPLLVAAAGLGCFGSAHAAFTGSFAPAAWTTSNSDGGNGSVTAGTDTLGLTSSDFTGSDVTFIGSVLDYSVAIAAPTTLHFDWAYTTADDGGSSNDTFGYALDGVAFQLSADASFAPQAGSATVTVGAGQRFSFQMDSLDSFGGSATATISNFTVSAVPEPQRVALLLAGLGVVGFAVRRARARQV